LILMEFTGIRSCIKNKKYNIIFINLVFNW
jgi:hypothetical protein